MNKRAAEREAKMDAEYNELLKAQEQFAKETEARILEHGPFTEDDLWHGYCENNSEHTELQVVSIATVESDRSILGSYHCATCKKNKGMW